MFKSISDKSVSPGSIGGKIRRLRELRGLTQRELGMRCGFSETTAGVRIRQYESNQKTPREDALKALAAALEVDDTALFDADLSNPDRALHALFDIEDSLGLHPVEVRGKYYLEFSGKTRFSGQDVLPGEHMELLKEWAKRRAAFLSASPDDAALREEEYDLWRAAYVTNEGRKNTGSIRRRKK